MEKEKEFYQEENFLIKLKYFIINLRELNKLDKHHKLAIDTQDNFYLQNINSEYFISVKRWWYNFSRYQNVEAIDAFYLKLFIFIDYLLDIYENNKCNKRKDIAKENILILFEHIKCAKKGLIILKLVYKDDIKLIDGINRIIEFISQKCRNLTNIIYLKKNCT